MDLLTYLLPGMILLLSAIYFYVKYKDFPPGPYGLPGLGYSPFLGENGVFTITNLKEKYGNIFSVSFGPSTVVFVNDWDSIKDVFIKQGAATNARPSLFMTNKLFSKKGVAFNSGLQWREQRNFTFQALRDFGLGKSSLESLIMFEIEKLTDYLNENAGKPIEIHRLLLLPSLNIIWSISSGKRFEKFDEFLANYKAFRVVATNHGNYGILNHLPFLRFLIPQLNRTFHKVDDGINKIKAYVENEILNHESAFQANNLKDFIDVYLAEIYRHREKSVNGQDVPPFDREHLIATIIDLFIAGGDTTDATMCWALLHMADNPEIQRKVQAELDAVVAKDSFLSTSLKALAPYTEATLLEIQRHPTLSPLAGAHVTTKDVILRGYKIPKGTTIHPNIYAVHHDEAYWCDPDVFRPERFLNEDGTKVLRHERCIPFSVGPRACLGESLAKMELHLLFSTLLRRFTFEPVPGQPKPSTDVIPGVLFRPHPFSLIISSR